VSGGEPLQQAAFTCELPRFAQQTGLHTALDTSGFLRRRADDELLDATDLVLLDIKAGTEATHRWLTGRPLAPTLEFAERVDVLPFHKLGAAADGGGARELRRRAAVNHS
jgi:pyruvate formate lyase activating enzyme